MTYAEVQEKAAEVVVDGTAVTGVGLTVLVGSAVYAQAALPVPVVMVAYIPVPVLHSHQVAGLYVAAPRLEPALQENDLELDEVCTQPGGFSSTALFGQMTTDAVVIVGDIVLEDGAAEVPVWELVTMGRLPDAREQELRLRSWRSRLVFVVSKTREMLYFQAALLVFSYLVKNSAHT